MKFSLPQHGSRARIASLLFLLLPLAGVNAGCGNNAADSSTPVPYASGRNPAAVTPAPVSANPIGARGGPPEAEVYRQKMGPNAKPPGAR
jgi:hypothetical protein